MEAPVRTALNKAAAERALAAAARSRRAKMPAGSPQRLVLLEFAEAHDWNAAKAETVSRESR